MGYQAIACNAQQAYYKSNTTSLANWIGFWKFETSAATNVVTSGSSYLTDAMTAPVASNTVLSYSGTNGINGSNMGCLFSADNSTRMTRNVSSRPGGGTFTSFSVMMWVKNPDVTSSYNFLWRLTQNNDASGSYIAGTGGGSTASIYGGAIVYTSKYLKTDNNWHSYVWVFNPSSVTIYVDGVVFSTTQITIPAQIINYAMIEDRRYTNGGSIFVDNFGVIGSEMTQTDVKKFHARMFPDSSGKWTSYDPTKWFGAWDCNSPTGLNRITGSTGSSLTIAQGGTYAGYADLPFDALQQAPTGTSCFGSPEQNPTGGKVRAASLTSSTISAVTYGGWIKPGVTRPTFAIYYGTGSTFTLSDLFLVGIIEGASNHSALRLGSIGGNSGEFVSGSSDVWQHWAASIDLINGIAKMYVNGLLITTFNYTPSFTSVTGLKIMFATTEGYGYPYSSGYFDGLFAYNGILEQSTIADLACKNKFINSSGSIKTYSPQKITLIAGYYDSQSTGLQRMYSNGIWEQFSLTGGIAFSTWTGIQWVAADNSNNIKTSPDGIVWTNNTTLGGTPAAIISRGNIVAIFNTNNTLRISEDGGTTWNANLYTPFYGTNINNTNYVPSMEIIGTKLIISGSVTGGGFGNVRIAWIDTVSIPPPGTPWNVVTIADGSNATSLVYKNNILYLSVWYYQSYGTKGGVYQSTDAGQTWAFIANNLPSNYAAYGLRYSDTRSVWTLTNTNANLLYESTNLATWTQNTNALPASIQDYASVNGEDFIMAYTGGIYKYNGTGFTQVVSGISAVHYGTRQL